MNYLLFFNKLTVLGIESNYVIVLQGKTNLKFKNNIENRKKNP